jgi:hypothetical protein
MVESPGLFDEISSDYRPALPGEPPDSFRDNNWIADRKIGDPYIRREKIDLHEIVRFSCRKSSRTMLS